MEEPPQWGAHRNEEHSPVGNDNIVGDSHPDAQQLPAPPEPQALGRRQTHLQTGSFYARNVREASSFESMEMLRGVPLSRVLRKWARIFNSNQGTASDYDLSEPVTRLEAFLSHNWSAPRHKKFLTLVLYYNLAPAIAIGLCSAMITSVLVAAKIVPLIYPLQPQQNVRWTGQTCELVGFVVFVVTLFTWHEIAGLCGGRIWGPAVFLDKACVHQTDDELKRKGIQSLAAFLTHSERLVILHSEEYLKRLWTVYELASFMLLNPKGHLEILPLSFPVMLLAALLLVCIDISTCASVLRPCEAYDRILKAWDADSDCIVKVALDGIVFACLLHHWARIWRRMKQQLQGFDIREAQCSCEEDRPRVESNVEAFVKHIGKVPWNASRTDALKAFNELVHNTVPQLMAGSMGPPGVRYKVALLMSMRLLFQPFDVAAIDVLLKHSMTATAAETIRSLALVFLRGPLVIAVGAVVAKRFAHLTGAAAVVAIAANMCIIQTVSHALSFILFTLCLWAKADAAWLLPYVAICCCLGLVTFRIYSPRNRKALQHPRCASVECKGPDGVVPRCLQGCRKAQARTSEKGASMV